MGQAGVITVTARFRARPGQAEALIPLLTQLAQHSRGEDGCLDYGYFRDGDNFTSIEHWDSAGAEAAHNDTDFLRSTLRLILPLLFSGPAPEAGSSAAVQERRRRTGGERRTASRQLPERFMF